MTDVFPGATLMQLVEWGFPMGVPRPTPPADRAWSVIHITGNHRLPSAENEAAWRIRDPAFQNSATFFVNRNGSIVQTLGDPLHMDPYANGDWSAPDLSNPRIAWWYARRSYYNANELTLLAIENVGYEPGSPITAAQEDACARIIAYYHAKAGVPVNRQTVIGHYQLNSTGRPNCPGVDKRLIDRIVAGAAAALPDAAMEDPMPKVIRTIVGQEAVIRAGANVYRDRPAFGASHFEVPQTIVQPTFEVVGDAYRTSTGTADRWIEFGATQVAQRRYVPAPYVTLRPIDTGQVRVDRALTAVDGALQANKAAQRASRDTETALVAARGSLTQ